ncbi:MAG: hypothetical protein AAFO04_29540 [Cyanobacteria bacterium J06592_8]
MQSTRTPIFIHEDESQKSLNILQGLTERYRLKVTNSDNQDLLIVIWIKANDGRSKPIERWCTIIDDKSSINNRLRLKPNESLSIELQFEVPQQAAPGTYYYTIFAEAPEQYPDQIFRRPQQLRVSLDREIEWDYEPEFILPVTNPNKPYELQAGEEVEIPIQVKNRSRLVDRFYVICPDLEPDWYEVRYPEVNTNLPGLIRETDGLELNPEDPPGEIKLILHPPKYTPAGNYFPTIQLISKNNESQLIIRVFYLLILPEYQLDFILKPSKNKIKKGKTRFEIELANQGNTKRYLFLTPNFLRQEKLWNCYFYPHADLRLFPSKRKTITLEVQRKGWRWRRLIPRKALELPFDIEIEDAQNLPLDRESRQGTLIWDRSPWWHLWLLILLALGILAGTAFAIWWNYFKMPPLPKINEFSTLKPSQKYDEGEPIEIEWEVRHPQQLDKLVLTRINSQGSREFKNYPFLDGKPDFLDEVRNNNEPCQLNEEEKFSRCRLTLAPPSPDKYTLEIETFPKSINERFRKRSSNDASDSSRMDTIEIIPKPLPELSQVNDITSPKSTYSKAQEEEIILQFDLKHQSQLAQLDIITQGSDQVIRTASYVKGLENTQLQPKNIRNTWGNLVCEAAEKPEDLSCEWRLNTRLIEPGNYTLKVAVYSSSNPKESSDSQPLQNTIVVQPEPLPELEQFTVAKAVYEEAQKEPIKLNWVIQNPNSVKELIITAQSQTGSSQEIQRYQYPNQVSQFCSIPATVDLPLVCRDVPTKTLPPGEYTLQLNVIPEKAQEMAKITRTSPPVKVIPTPIEIEFIVNDQSITQAVENYPPIAMSSEGTPIFLQLAWKVKGGEGIQVELQPLAGVIQPEGSMTYTISQAPLTETITLLVTNSLGEQETRSIVIQTYESNSSSPSPFSIPKTGELETPESGIIQPLPSQPGRSFPSESEGLEPLEIPPQPD